jgi:hypothetical protein
MTKQSSKRRGFSGLKKKTTTAQQLHSLLSYNYRKNAPVRETEWTRDYTWGETTVRESKFLMDGLEVSAESIIERWPALSFEQRCDFAQAYSTKPTITTEDERILNFLMSVGDSVVARAITMQLPRHRDKERVLTFLLQRIGEDRVGKANFFQALGLMQDKRAVPVLRAAFENYRNRSSGLPNPTGEADCVDYLTCCEALWRLDGSKEYLEVIVAFSKSEDIRVRDFATALLQNQ